MGASTAVDQDNPCDGAPGEARHERLGGARAEFVANLGRRAAELRAALTRLEGQPDSLEGRDELQRRMHALAAAARLLRFVMLADRVDEGAALLEGAGEALSADETGALRKVLDQIPALAWGQTAVQEGGAGATLLRGEAANTGRGLAPVRGSSEAAPETLPDAPRARGGTRGDRARGAAERGGVMERGSERGGAEGDGGAPLTALVVGGEPLAEALTPGIADAGPVFEVERTGDATTAIDLARALAPDVVVLDTDLPGARALAEALTSDPLTEPVPILALGAFARADDAAPFVALGVARALAKPVSPDALRRAAAEAAATYGRGEVTRSPLGEVTLDQLGARLAEELRRGLCDAAEARGRGAAVDLGEGAEVLAALWGAVARIRDVVTIRSRGAVRFSPSGPEGALPLAPWIGPAEGGEATRGKGRGDRWGSGCRAPSGDPGPGVMKGAAPALEGLGVVVADDDPAVTWFLAGVLRAAGAVVHEAHDGARALDLAYQTAPDLVVSDVLMPRLDGFALCRALRRDVVLRDVPVILLSWKEDLLQRLRELGADADGYLRKEASAAAIVQRVREVMAPRRRVAERIAAGGEVRGRLDGLTTRTLLALACAHRPASVVSVRDAAFLYEVALRGGQPAGATRTAPDGTFQRGPAVLAGLLGVGSGRFVVAPAPEGEPCSSHRAGFEGSLAEQLMPAIASARAAQRLLSGAALVQVERVEIDEERMSAYAGATPEPARSLLRRLIGGASPRALITSGQASPRLIEDVLCDAAAHGSVTGVLDRAGEDLLAAATASEIDLLKGMRRAPPPAPALAPEIAAGPRLGEPPASLEEILGAAASMTPGPVALASAEAPAQSEAIPPAAERGQAAADPAAPAVVIAKVVDIGSPAAAAPVVEAPAPRRVEPPAPARPVEAPAPVLELPKPGPIMSLGSLTPPPVVEPQQAAAPIVAAAPPPGPARVEPRPAVLEESPVPRKVKRPSAYAPSPPQPAPARESRTTMWVLFAVAAFVFAVGARLSRERELRAAAPQVAQVAAPTATEAAVLPAPPAPPPPAGPGLGVEGETAGNPVLPEELPLPAGEAAQEGQGVLEVIAGPNDALLVDGRAVGTGTVKVPLAPKAEAYEIRARLRGEERVRFARVVAGRLTRVRVSPPWRR